jgi:DNA repair exonuclease SbcCD ATPase subunit
MELDLEAIEERMVLYERGVFRGSTYDDIAALLARARQQDVRIAQLEAVVKGLREEKADLEQALHVAPVKYQLAIANHIFMTDASLCLEVTAPLAHTELIKVGQQILEGVGQYDIQSQLEAEVKRLEAEVKGLREELDEINKSPMQKIRERVDAKAEERRKFREENPDYDPAEALSHLLDDVPPEILRRVFYEEDSQAAGQPEYTNQEWDDNDPFK